jgi:hypothetical protein
VYFQPGLGVNRRDGKEAADEKKSRGNVAETKGGG